MDRRSIGHQYQLHHQFTFKHIFLGQVKNWFWQPTLEVTSNLRIKSQLMFETEQQFQDLKSINRISENLKSDIVVKKILEGLNRV